MSVRVMITAAIHTLTREMFLGSYNDHQALDLLAAWRFMSSVYT